MQRPWGVLFKLKFLIFQDTMNLKIITLLGLFLLPAMLYASDEILITSPSGKIVVQAGIENKRMRYAAFYGKEQILRPSDLGFVLSGNDSLCFFEVTGTVSSSWDETWKPVWGQYNEIRNHYNQVIIHLRDLRSKRLLDVCFRVYDDGFAYRYCFPEGPSETIIMSEESSFAFAEDHTCWWIWADYNTLEKLYFKTPLKKASHVADPFTMRTQQGTYLSVHEAALDDYSSMTLKQDAGDSLKFRVNLVPWADGTAVKASGAFSTPWRVVFVSPTAGGLLESSLLLNLNAPCILKDVSWIKPIKYIGVWWEMHLGLSTWMVEGGRHGATTANAKKYIDFAAAHHIEGVVIEGWNTGWERWGEKDAFDYITAYPDFDLKTVVEYARSKGVEIIGHHETGGDIVSYEKNLDSAFALYQRLGIRYVKTGYAGPVNPSTEWHHGQYMVRHYNKVMQTAAKYHIMLDVHEPVIPTGLGRTYPNLMTGEGVRGMEWNAWSEGNPPSHTCTLPFTRGLAGPMDYTPGIFDITESRYAGKRVRWNGLDKGNTAVHSTLCNQIALMVILYSPMQMAADLIENYQDHPAFDFVSQIPATWDETVVLEAEIGDYVVIARRKGTSWFIAGITNEKARTVSLNLDFLTKGRQYQVNYCMDGTHAHYEKNPVDYLIKAGTLTSGDTPQLEMAAGGGFVMILKVI